MSDELKWRHLARKGKDLRLHPVGGSSTKGDEVFVGYDLAIEPVLKWVTPEATKEEMLDSVKIEYTSSGVDFEAPPSRVYESSYGYAWAGGIETVIHTDAMSFNVKEIVVDMPEISSYTISRDKDGPSALAYYEQLYRELQNSGGGNSIVDKGKTRATAYVVVTHNVAPEIGPNSGIIYAPGGTYDEIWRMDAGFADLTCTTTFSTKTVTNEHDPYLEAVPDKADDFPRSDYYPKVKKKNNQEGGNEQ